MNTVVTDFSNGQVSDVENLTVVSSEEKAVQPDAPVQPHVSPTGEIVESKDLVRLLADADFASEFSDKAFSKWANDNNLELVYQDESGKRRYQQSDSYISNHLVERF